MVGRQRLALEDVQARAGYLARFYGVREVVHPAHHPPAYVDEVGGRLHQPEAAGVECEFGLRRVRDGRYHEVRSGQQRVQLAWGVDLRVWQDVLRARLDSDHFHADLVAEARGFVSDAAHAVDERGRLGQVYVRRLARALVPLAAALGVRVPRQAARQGEHEHHYVMRYVVEVDAARVANDERMRCQRGVVVAVERPGVRVLHPSQTLGDFERGGRNPAVHGVGVPDFAQGVGVRLRRGDFVLRQRVRQARGEHPAVAVLRGHEYELGHLAVNSLPAARRPLPATPAARRSGTSWSRTAA